MARRRRRGASARRVHRSYQRGGHGISNWLLKNWWVLAAGIVLFGALAWVDPAGIPGPGSLQSAAGTQVGGNVLDISGALGGKGTSVGTGHSCKKNSDCHCTGGTCSKGKCSCKGGIPASERKLVQATI